MKNKKIIGTVVITLIVAYLIYLYRDKIKSILPGATQTPSELETQTEVIENEQVMEPGNTNNGSGEVYDSEGCGGGYTNNLQEISELDPESNVGGCGSAVIAWQNFLNTQPNTGANIVVDGKYGAATLQKHINWLQVNPISGRDIVAPLYELGKGASLN